MCSSNKFKSSYQAWDYSFERVSLTCTLSLARKVEPLSTRCLATILVTLSAAFFGEWRFSRRMLLFVHLSSASLASYSTALTVYVFYPNNHFRLASFCEPNSLACQVLSTFHNIPEQSFAFWFAKLESNQLPTFPKKVALPNELFANLPRCAVPVAPYLVRYRIQHTSCLLPCELLNGFSSLPSSVQLSN